MEIQVVAGWALETSSTENVNGFLFSAMTQLYLQIRMNPYYTDCICIVKNIGLASSALYYIGKTQLLYFHLHCAIIVISSSASRRWRMFFSFFCTILLRKTRLFLCTQRYRKERQLKERGRNKKNDRMHTNIKETRYIKQQKSNHRRS